MNVMMHDPISVMTNIYQWTGFLGMVLVTIAYLLLQTHQYTVKSVGYQLLNLIGAILLLISLLVHFNLGSFLIELFWIGISSYGLFSSIKARKKKDNYETFSN